MQIYNLQKQQYLKLLIRNIQLIQVVILLRDIYLLLILINQVVTVKTQLLERFGQIVQLILIVENLLQLMLVQHLNPIYHV